MTKLQSRLRTLEVESWLKDLLLGALMRGVAPDVEHTVHDGNVAIRLRLFCAVSHGSSPSSTGGIIVVSREDGSSPWYGLLEEVNVKLDGEGVLGRAVAEVYRRRAALYGAVA